jgi:CHAT domain-containing protein
MPPLHHLKTRYPPATSIQQTQRDFIQGKVTFQDIQKLRSGIGSRAGAAPGIPDGISTDLTHPYYWAPFILIGNGL